MRQGSKCLYLNFQEALRSKLSSLFDLEEKGRVSDITVTDIQAIQTNQANHQLNGQGCQTLLPSVQAYPHSLTGY